jgi:hypothetical protein
MSNYLTVTELKASVGIGGDPIDFTSFTDGQLQEIIDTYEQMVENITGDIFYSKNETIFFDGEGKQTLFFTRKTPYKCLSITSVQEVEDDNESNVLTTYVEGVDYKKREHAISLLRDNWESARKSLFRGEWFPEGERNIKVVATWGNTSCPLEIKKAVRLLCLTDIAPGDVGLNKADLSRASWDDFSVSFRGVDSVSKKFESLTGYLDIDRILKRYINYSTLMDPI